MDGLPNALHEGLRSLLEHMSKIKASDLYLIADHPPVFRVDDASYPARVPLEADDVARMADSLMSAKQRERLRTGLELSVTFALREGERFRAGVFFQRGTLGLIVQRLGALRTLSELGHDPELHALALTGRGLTLVVGEKRSGRSSTLAALIDARNDARPGYILAIDDPIELVHAHKQCIVTQREVGTDTASFAAALKQAPQHAPDLIAVSEIRDAETMEAVLQLADAGHACVATFLARGACDALERVAGFFPEHRRAEIHARLARTLHAVIGQRLVRAQPEGRLAAIELLVATAPVATLIRRGDWTELATLLRSDEAEGSRSFDSSLFALCSTGRVSAAEAAKAADQPDTLLARVQRVRDSGRVEVPLRLSPEIQHEPAAVIAAPAPDRRSKVGLPR